MSRKARTTLSMQVTLELPASVTANDALDFVRQRIDGSDGPSGAINQAAFDKLAAIEKDGIKVSLLRKVTEYR